MLLEPRFIAAIRFAFFKNVCKADAFGHSQKCQKVFVLKRCGRSFGRRPDRDGDADEVLFVRRHSGSLRLMPVPKAHTHVYCRGDWCIWPGDPVPCERRIQAQLPRAAARSIRESHGTIGLDDLVNPVSQRQAGRRDCGVSGESSCASGRYA